MGDSETQARFAGIEAELRKLKKRKKDGWDKFNIALSILVPASIALAGHLFSKNIADGTTQVATISAKVEQARLVLEFMQALTDKQDGARRELAIRTVRFAFPEFGVDLLQQIVDSPAVPTAEREIASQVLEKLRNGELCNEDKDCLSKACYPGPERGKYCQASRMNCATPNGEGARYGQKIGFEGSFYECYRPSTGRANWRRT